MTTSLVVVSVMSESEPRPSLGEGWAVQPIYNTVVVQVTCEEDSVFEQIVQTAVSKLHQSLVPIQFNK